MPVPHKSVPRKDEGESQFVSRYVQEAIQRGAKGLCQEETAIAKSIYRNKNKPKKPKAQNITQNLTAMHEVAEEFEKQGNISAGKILTEAMKKIAQYDEPPRLPTGQRQDAEYLSQHAREMFGDKAWSPDRFEQLMRERADEPEPDMSPEANRQSFISAMVGPSEVGESPILEELEMLITTMEANASLFADSGLNSPQIEDQLEQTLAAMQKIFAIWAMATRKAQEDPTPEFNAFEGRQNGVPQSQRPNLRAV